MALGSSLFALLACQASTTRPYFPPHPRAPLTELELVVPVATRTIAEALREDSIPVVRVEERDGWLDSGWFDAATLRPTARWPLGDGVVRVRAWIGPSKPGHSEVVVETVYRPFADPSRPERELDRHVADDHPVQQRVTEVLRKLIERYGEPPPEPPVVAPPPARRDTTGADSARTDSTRRRRDTTSVTMPGSTFPIAEPGSGTACPQMAQITQKTEHPHVDLCDLWMSGLHDHALRSFSRSSADA